MVNTWQAFWRLKSLERRIVFEATAALTASWAGLRLLNFNRWKNLMRRFAPRPVVRDPSRQAEEISAALRIARLESGVARRMFIKTSCLEHSLTLWWLLQRQGIASDLRLGARKDAGRFEAHAWVEVRGEILEIAGAEHRHFVPFDGPLESAETKAQ